MSVVATPVSARRWRVCDADWNHWPDGLDDASVWQACADAGLAGVELGVYRVAEQLPPERLSTVSDLARRHDLPVAMLLLSLPAERWPDGALTSPATAAAVAVEAVGVARAAAGLGLDTIGLWPGADPPGAPLAATAEGVAAVADAVAAVGVRVAVEYKPGTALASASDGLALCGALPEVGILLDTGHAWAAGEDPAEVVARAGDRLWHVHLGDADEGEADDDLPVGRLHDFSAFTAALDTAGYSGAATFDLYGAVCAGALTGVAAARESHHHLLGCLA